MAGKYPDYASFGSEPLLLRGVERPTDLLHSQAIAQIERFGLEAAEQATRFYHE